MERDKGGINGRAWSEKRQRESDRIISKSKGNDF